jgi:integrase
MSEAGFSAAVGAALQRAGERWEPSTLAERARQCRGFSEWLAKLPASQQVSWGGCSPAHVLAYMEAEWLPSHGNRALGDGSMGTAASYMQSTLSHLSTTFKLLGRAAAWGTQAEALCNPVDSAAVAAYLGAYRKQYARAGYAAEAARPWKLEELDVLLRRLDSQLAASARGLSRALLLRDTAMLCFMADCGKRGRDCGRLQVSDFSCAAGGRALSERGFQPVEGEVWECRMFSKTRQAERGPCIKFKYTCQEPACVTNFLWRLQQYLAERNRCGAPLGRYLFNPGARGRAGFVDIAMSSQALQARVRGHLRAAGMEHSTLHGLRRALRQDLEAGGADQASAMQALDIRSDRTDRLYADRDRPVRGGGNC